MIIRKLQLRNFGKFQNKEVLLKEEWKIHHTQLFAKYVFRYQEDAGKSV